MLASFPIDPHVGRRYSRDAATRWGEDKRRHKPSTKQFGLVWQACSEREEKTCIECHFGTAILRVNQKNTDRQQQSHRWLSGNAKGNVGAFGETVESGKTQAVGDRSPFFPDSAPRLILG
jgi:hypothetical protein